MNKEVIDAALAIILPVADTYQPEDYLYEVMIGTNKDFLQVHGSLDTYCHKCIGAAVAEKKREYFIDRQQFMGKIFEYQQKGYYLEPRYVFGKDGRFAGKVCLHKVQSKEPKEKVVKQLLHRLRTEYPASMIFTYEAHNVSCSEHDGFESCDSCGVFFNQSLLLTDQELEYWESLSDEALKKSLSTPSAAYELSKIIGHWNPEEYEDRVVALAKRLL